MPKGNTILDLTLDDIEKLSVVIAVIGGKGGIGKSLSAQLISAKLRITHRLLLADTDHM